MRKKPSTPDIIERKRTASENFHRGRPVEIHRSSVKVVKLIPESVRHSTGEWRMKAAITEYDPRKGGDEGVKRINLNEDDVLVLAEALRRVEPVMTQDAEGRYVAVKVDARTENAADAVRSIIGSLSSDTDLLETLAEDDTFSKLDEVILHVGRLATLKRAVRDLADALDRNESKEAFFQKWCVRNSWAFGFNYLDADKIRRITREDQVDLMLPRLFGGFRDLVELKTPGVKVLDSVRDIYYLSRSASEALGQAVHYMSVLQRHAHGFGGLQGAEEVRAYRPSAIVVIGSSQNWTSAMREAWHTHNRALNDVQLWTLEELLTRGNRLISVLGSEKGAIST